MGNEQSTIPNTLPTTFNQLGERLNAYERVHTTRPQKKSIMIEILSILTAKIGSTLGYQSNPTTSENNTTTTSSVSDLSVATYILKMNESSETTKLAASLLHLLDHNNTNNIDNNKNNQDNDNEDSDSDQPENEKQESAPIVEHLFACLRLPSVPIQLAGLKLLQHLFSFHRRFCQNDTFNHVTDSVLNAAPTLSGSSAASARSKYEVAERFHQWLHGNFNERAGRVVKALMIR